MGGGPRQRGPSTLSAAELEAAVEAALNRLFAGDRDDVPLDELVNALRQTEPRAAAAGREALVTTLDAMEAANKVMHREGRIHLI